LQLPELYRGAPISLTWEYFGFDKNLYKPAGFYDGIYLWNPHPWDEEHLFFSFDELVRVGAQYVVYPFMDPHQFKYWRRAANMDEYLAGSGSLSNNFPDAYTEYVFETEDPMINTVSSKYRDKTAIHHWSVPGANAILNILF